MPDFHIWQVLCSDHAMVNINDCSAIAECAGATGLGETLLMSQDLFPCCYLLIFITSSEPVDVSGRRSLLWIQ